ncbi:hypothetical protein K492DRAFT_203665 [Lichtheimia hyalospora FSU 10163]|nr:hypothetical protein K492DRAFT_203665 [Lichtheimia hyalospora FSU 10163]
MDVECTLEHNTELITRVVSDLFSFNETQQKRILDHYYFHDASFESPLLVTSGIYNIRHILLLWKTLNKIPPTITNLCFNGKATCVVYLTQHLCPRVFPFVQLDLPVIVTLEFKETDIDSGLFKIHHHKESWTLEGLIQAVPLISFWYEHVVRVMMGKAISSTGEIIHSAVETAHLLSHRNCIISSNCNDIMIPEKHKHKPEDYD